MTSVAPLSGTNQTIIDNYLKTQNVSSTPAVSESGNDLSKVMSDYNTFLKLLTVQMQYQDPLAPTDPNEYTKQLTQFSAVEQSIKTNGKLDELIKLSGGNGISPLLGYLDRYAEVPSEGALPLQNGKAQIGYQLKDVASEVDIAVRDSQGVLVALLEGKKNIGNHFVSWDGKSGNTQLPDGLYKFEIIGKNMAGADLKPSNVTVVGQVTTLATTKDGPQLSLGNYVIPEDKILSLTTIRPQG